MAMSARIILNRIILVLFGVCLSLVVIEGILRIGALFVGRESGLEFSRFGKWRILCLGDSNTYGLYVDKSQAYPKVFESTWNAMPENAGWAVEALNLGFPGTNSSKLVKEFRHMLATFHPDVVTVMIGADDPWTMSETTADTPDHIDRVTAALWKASRAYRFLYMLWRALQNRQLKVTAELPAGRESAHGTARYGSTEFQLGWTRIPKAGIAGWEPALDLAKNLRTLTEQAADFGTKLIFLTYPADAGLYAWADPIIRGMAKETGTPLIDVAAVFKGLCPAPGSQCPELFFADEHPTVLGYERVAEILAQQLLPALRQSH